MSTLAAYAGRTIDYQIVYGVPLQQLALVAEDGQGRVLTGILKLCQRFVVLLLTRIGSVVYLPNYGCTFLLDQAMGDWRTIADIQQSFNATLPDVRRQLQALETAADPPDERFASARLLAVEMTPQLITVKIEVSSLAGASYVLITPVTSTTT